jgi:hypothetical protein
MSELLEWTTSIEVRSAVSGFKVGSPYPEESVNEEVHGNLVNSMRDECRIHRMQRHVLHKDRDKEVDGDHHEGCGHQESAVVLAIANTVHHKGSAFDELRIWQLVQR